MPPTTVKLRSIPSRIASAEPSRKTSSRLRGTIRPSQQMRNLGRPEPRFDSQLPASAVSAPDLQRKIKKLKIDGIGKTEFSPPEFDK